MREIKASKITEVVKKLCMDANVYLPDDVIRAIKQAKEREESQTGKRCF